MGALVRDGRARADRSSPRAGWLSPCSRCSRSRCAGRLAGRGFRVQRLCGTARPGAAQCQAMRLLPSSATPAKIRANAVAQARQRAAGREGPGQRQIAVAGLPDAAEPARRLRAAERNARPRRCRRSRSSTRSTTRPRKPTWPSMTNSSACPRARPRTAAFARSTSRATPARCRHTEGEWASEISIDVQMAHAICQGCRVLLVEADSEEFSDLGAAVNAAVAAGATEISNSYAGPEEALYTSLTTRATTTIRASSSRPAPATAAISTKPAAETHAAANFPADSPDVRRRRRHAPAANSKGVWTAPSGTKAAAAAAKCSKRRAWQTRGRELRGDRLRQRALDRRRRGDRRSEHRRRRLRQHARRTRRSRPAGASGAARRSPRRSSPPSSRSPAARTASPTRPRRSTRTRGEAGALYDVVSGSNGSLRRHARLRGGGRLRRADRRRQPGRAGRVRAARRAGRHHAAERRRASPNRARR